MKSVSLMMSSRIGPTLLTQGNNTFVNLSPSGKHKLFSFYRSPNPTYFLNSWPKYESPSWKYMNLSSGPDGSVSGMSRLADRCELWNDVVPMLSGEGSMMDDESDEEDDMDVETCT